MSPPLTRACLPPSRTHTHIQHTHTCERHALEHAHALSNATHMPTHTNSHPCSHLLLLLCVKPAGPQQQDREHAGAGAGTGTGRPGVWSYTHTHTRTHTHTQSFDSITESLIKPLGEDIIYFRIIPCHLSTILTHTNTHTHTCTYTQAHTHNLSTSLLLWPQIQCHISQSTVIVLQW